MNVVEIIEELKEYLDAKYLGRIPQRKDKKIDLRGIEVFRMAPEVEKMGRETQNQYNIEMKIRLAVEIFVRSGFSLSDVEISSLLTEAHEVDPRVPTISRSSIDRYLKDEWIREFYSDDIYRVLLEKRKENLMAAKSKGGKSYAQNNVAVFDEDGKFAGSIKR